MSNTINCYNYNPTTKLIVIDTLNAIQQLVKYLIVDTTKTNDEQIARNMIKDFNSAKRYFTYDMQNAISSVIGYDGGYGIFIPQTLTSHAPAMIDKMEAYVDRNMSVEDDMDIEGGVSMTEIRTAGDIIDKARRELKKTIQMCLEL